VLNENQNHKRNDIYITQILFRVANSNFVLLREYYARNYLMNRIKVEILFILILSIWVVILSQTVPIDKAEFFGLTNPNPWYKWSLIIIYIAFILFNYIVLQLRVFTNLVYTVIVGVICLPTTFIVVRLFIWYLEKIDNQVTPLGWQYNLKWIEPLIFGLFLILATELIGKRFKKRKPAHNVT